MLCKWCASAGADLAGVSRLEYPPNILPIRVMCSGRVDPLFILRALEAGADGVFIGACHPGDCHYVDGNIKAKKRFDFLLKILEPLGLKDRLTLEYVSASEARKFKEVTTAFTEKIRQLGPSPIGMNRKLVDLTITDESHKKQAIYAVLKALAEAVGYQPTEPFIIPAEETMEGYGFPIRDPDKCIGCYACYNICPEQVITLEDIENRRVFGTLSHACVVCNKCQELCPQEAIEIVPGFELMAYLTQTPIEDINLELQQCEKCHSYFAASKHVEFVEEKVQNSIQDLHIPVEQHGLCPECRRKQIAKKIQSKWLEQAALFMKGGG